MTYKELQDLTSKQGEMIQTLINELNSLKRAPVPSGDPLVIAKNQIRHANLYEVEIEGMCSATPGTETEHKHNLPGTPKRVIITETSGGIVYLTGVTSSVIKVKSTVTVTTFKAYCII